MGKHAAIEKFWGWGTSTGIGRVHNDLRDKVVLGGDRTNPTLINAYIGAPISGVEQSPVLTQQLDIIDGVNFVPTTYQVRPPTGSMPDVRRRGIQQAKRLRSIRPGDEDIVIGAYNVPVDERGGAALCVRDDSDDGFSLDAYSQRRVLLPYNENFSGGDFDKRWERLRGGAGIIDPSFSDPILGDSLRISPVPAGSGYSVVQHRTPVFPDPVAEWEASMRLIPSGSPVKDSFVIAAMSIIPRFWAPYGDHPTAIWATIRPVMVGILYAEIDDPQVSVRKPYFWAFFGRADDFTRNLFLIGEELPDDLLKFRIRIDGTVAEGRYLAPNGFWANIGLKHSSGSEMFVTGNPFGYYAALWVQSTVVSARADGRFSSFKLNDGEWTFGADRWILGGSSWDSRGADFFDTDVGDDFGRYSGDIVVGTHYRADEPKPLAGGHSLGNLNNRMNDDFATYPETSKRGTDVLSRPGVLATSDLGVFVETVVPVEDEPPFVENEFPVGEVLPFSSLYCEVKDAPPLFSGGTGVDLGSIGIRVSLNGAPLEDVVIGGVFAGAAWTGTISDDATGGFYIDFSRVVGDFVSGDVVDVYVDASDNAGNMMTTYHWQASVLTFEPGLKFNFFREEIR